MDRVDKKSATEKSGMGYKQHSFLDISIDKHKKFGQSYIREG